MRLTTANSAVSCTAMGVHFFRLPFGGWNQVPKRTRRSRRSAREYKRALQPFANQGFNAVFRRHGNVRPIQSTHDGVGLWAQKRRYIVCGLRYPRAPILLGPGWVVVVGSKPHNMHPTLVRKSTPVSLLTSGFRLWRRPSRRPSRNSAPNHSRRRNTQTYLQIQGVMLSPAA